MNSLKKINEILNNDGVIAFVTDTVWGIGCLPTNEKAVQKIYEIKKREAQKPLILMSHDIYPLLDYVKQFANIVRVYEGILAPENIDIDFDWVN